MDLTTYEGPRAPCHLSVDPGWDRLTAIEYGSVWDGQLPDEYLKLGEDERIQFLLDEDQTRIKALIVHEPFEVEPLELDAPELWEGPEFDVPTVGLVAATPGEVILAAQGRYGPEEPTLDAAYFHMAMSAADEGDAELAIGFWRAAIEAGDMKAHYGLGYTLCDEGRYREAYDHLRLYTRLTPHNAWAWCWYGQACEKLGHRRDAADAYRRAVELERRGGLETDADERLQSLEPH